MSTQEHQFNPSINCPPVQQINPYTGFVDPQWYYPVFFQGNPDPWYYIEPYGYVKGASSSYENDWTQQNYNSPLL